MKNRENTHPHNGLGSLLLWNLEELRPSPRFRAATGIVEIPRDTPLDWDAVEMRRSQLTDSDTLSIDILHRGTLAARLQAGPSGTEIEPFDAPAWAARLLSEARDEWLRETRTKTTEDAAPGAPRLR